MKIIDKINSAIAQERLFHSYEYFPPKTDQGIQNLYARIERQTQSDPLFIDVTWGAGGSTSDKTIEIATNAQNVSGVETQIHMTCTNMKVEDLDAAIQHARDNGIQNILCLRGDPPNFLEGGNQEWKQTEGGFQYAKDLVRYIRQKHGNYFGLAVAGYPEGHPDGSYEDDLKYLKEKIDAGAELIITQLFYDVDQFLKFVRDCRSIGISCPILPGIMPMNNYKSWQRMVGFCKCNIPDNVTKALEKINVEDDEQVKQFGIDLCVDMCRRLIANGIRGLHLYTLNLEKSTTEILQNLELMPQGIQRTLPWKATANAKRATEDVRPIFWSNRPISYIDRTSAWDEFPNGRWGSSDSPAFGELSDYHLVGLYSKGKPEKRKKLWGEELNSVQDVHEVFCKFLRGEVKSLPWCERDGFTKEITLIQKQLLTLNGSGILTINSQPKVNAVSSSDAIVGWGPKNGFVYQKAYLEFFCTPEIMQKLWDKVKEFPSLSMHAINKSGESKNNNDRETSTAVTWGVFPNSEIKQPTVVDTHSFEVWKDEAFALWSAHWADIYEKGTKSREIIENIVDNYFLVHILDNDYISGDIFAIFRAIGVSVEKQ